MKVHLDTLKNKLTNDINNFSVISNNVNKYQKKVEKPTTYEPKIKNGFKVEDIKHLYTEIEFNHESYNNDLTDAFNRIVNSTKKIVDLYKELAKISGGNYNEENLSKLKDGINSFNEVQNNIQKYCITDIVDSKHENYQMFGPIKVKVTPHWTHETITKINASFNEELAMQLCTIYSIVEVIFAECFKIAETEESSLILKMQTYSSADILYLLEHSITQKDLASKFIVHHVIKSLKLEAELFKDMTENSADLHKIIMDEARKHHDLQGFLKTQYKEQQQEEVAIVQKQQVIKEQKQQVVQQQEKSATAFTKTLIIEKIQDGSLDLKDKDTLNYIVKAFELDDGWVRDIAKYKEYHEELFDIIFTNYFSNNQNEREADNDDISLAGSGWQFEQFE